MREHAERIEALDVDVAVVATGAVWQAKRLTDEGSAFPLYVDATRAVYHDLSIERFGLWGLIRPSTWRTRRHAREASRVTQGDVTGDWRSGSGVAIFVPDENCARRLHWRHVAAGYGDYPPVETIVAQLHGL